jgi:phage gp45-like
MAPLINDVETMAEVADASTATGNSGARPTATVSGESVAVLEPYAFASTPPGTSQALVVAPGTDGENRVTAGLSAPAGRPATDAGDAAIWTAAGHSILLDDDGGILLTSKDGATIDIPATGAINVTAGTGASITLNVDPGAFVDAGGTFALALGQKVIDTIDAAWAAATPVANDGGAALKTSWLFAWNGVKSQILATITRGR